jgi:hypothetical protein
MQKTNRFTKSSLQFKRRKHPERSDELAQILKTTSQSAVEGCVCQFANHKKSPLTRQHTILHGWLAGWPMAKSPASL